MLLDQPSPRYKEPEGVSLPERLLTWLSTPAMRKTRHLLWSLWLFGTIGLGLWLVLRSSF